MAGLATPVREAVALRTTEFSFSRWQEKLADAALAAWAEKPMSELLMSWKLR
jgi:hypothetical protein